MNEGTILVGIDFEENFTQVSCIANGALVPESEKIGRDTNRYRIPTSIYRNPKDGEWLCGEAAFDALELCDGGYIGNMFELAETGMPAIISGHAYSSAFLLEVFFGKIFSVLGSRYPGCSFGSVTVTTAEPCEKLEAALKSAFSLLGIEKDRVRLISNIDSFMYYAVNQKGDMWLNDVGCFDYDSEGLRFISLSFGRRKKPVAVSSTVQNYSDVLPAGAYEEENSKNASQELEKIAAALYSDHVFSTIYATGVGFEGDWADEVLRSWSLGRRIFKGQNLYCKGACYAAEIAYSGREEEYFFIRERMIRGEIGMKVFSGNRETEIVLAKEGTDYTDVNTSFDVILEDTDEIAFTLRNSMKKDYICAITNLDGLPKRERKTVRLNVNLRFYDAERAIVTVRDLGFGKFYESTHRIWEYIINI